MICNSRIPKIEDVDLEFDNIYPERKNNEYIPPEEISKFFFYYFTIDVESQKSYRFIMTEQRKKLEEILIHFLYSGLINNNVIKISAPKGSGKTASLLFFSFIKYLRIFYFNLERFNTVTNDREEKKQLLLIELNKLYGDCTDKNNTKKDIENYITNINKENGFDFIYNVITMFLKFSKENNKKFCFIIDQYSEDYDDISRDKMKKIINLAQSNNNIKLIICPTINNEFSKNNISDNFYNNNLIKIYYFQEFISKEIIIEKIIENDESEHNKYFIKELSCLPKYYYDIKKGYDIKKYKEHLKLIINKNLKKYYNDDMIENILVLLDLILGERLISSMILKEKIKFLL